MKTLPKLKEELSEVEDGWTTAKKSIDPKERRKIKGFKERHKLIKQAILYIETEPDPIFVVKQLKDVEAKIDRRMAEFVLEGSQINAAASVISKLKRDHKKKYGVPALEAQKKMLKYLLS